MIKIYFSGSIDIQKIFFSNGTAAKAISYDYPDFTVAVPPANLSISGLDVSLFFSYAFSNMFIFNINLEVLSFLLYCLINEGFSSFIQVADKG